MRFGNKPLSLITILTAMLTLGCMCADSFVEGATQGYVEASFCDTILPQAFPSNAQAFVPPADILRCMHPTGQLAGASVVTTITSCKDVENFELSQTYTMQWMGSFNSYRTGVRVDIRSAGGYASFRSTKTFDEAMVRSSPECTDGTWRQTDTKLIDADAIREGSRRRR
jgi:hypothetical protein